MKNILFAFQTQQDTNKRPLKMFSLCFMKFSIVCDTILMMGIFTNIRISPYQVVTVLLEKSKIL